MAAQPDLKRAYQLIKARQKDEALTILMPLLRQDESNADAWWLIAHAVTDPGEIREALEMVIKLRPDNAAAKDKLAKLNAQYPPPKPKEEFVFDADDGLFESFVDDEEVGFPAEKPKRGAATNNQPRLVVTKSSSNGPNPILIMLAVIGVISLLICGGCVLASVQGLTLFGQAVQEIAANITPMPSIGGSIEDTTIGALNAKGPIGFGQSLSDTINDAFDNHVYTFNGDTGQNITIEANANDNELDTELKLYGPDNKMIAENDDIDLFENSNSQINISLPASGTYTIIVSGFATGGSYTLTLH
ncbi:MAG TPA: pre-peptidase C-terminal domain-containing protein [Phototrophicaceae bacterium]|nr:pre-peptidase C-terminal domain-containing protein [Phototrophicaceae bacterium]